MEIKQQLETALKEAMRSGNEIRKRTIRLALASLKMAEIDQGKPLDAQRQLAILQKEVKTREESIEAATTGGRNDLIDSAKAEINVLKEFMPAQMADEEIRDLVQEAIRELSASSPADMGRVMKSVLPIIGGRAASNRVSDIVKSLLNERQGS